MAGLRRALLFVTDDYADPEFGRLLAPAVDAERLSEVLADPRIGAFEVKKLRNEPASAVLEEIDDFFADRDPDDLLLLYFSGHGDKDADGELHFAMTNTRKSRLVSTGVPASTVRKIIDASGSQSVLVWLDCCVGGAFPEGLSPKGEPGDGVAGQLDPGRGCYVMTAATSVQTAFEDATDEDAPYSVFTDVIITGLGTGQADLDADGRITAAELFDYVRAEMRRRDARQTPTKSHRGTEEPVVAWNRHLAELPADVPAELRAVLLRGTPQQQRDALRDLALKARRGGDATVLELLTGSPSAALAGLAAEVVAEVDAELRARGMDDEAVLEAARADYLRWVVATHDHLQITGLHRAGGTVEIPLERMYVALRVDPTSPTERAAAHEMLVRDLEQRVRLADLTPEEEERLWWKAHTELPVADHIATGARLNTPLLNIGEVCRTRTPVVVLGDPGSGKTTMARWLAIMHARAMLDGADEVTVPVGKIDAARADSDAGFRLGRPLLPVLARVAEFAERIDAGGEGAPSVLDFLAEHSWFGSRPVWSRDVAGHRTGDPVPAPIRRELLRRAVAEGRALIVLDGLDEIADPAARVRVSEAVTEFVRAASREGSRLFITSRIAGYHLRPLPASLTHVTIERLTDESMRVFFHAWMREVDRQIRGADAHTGDATGAETGAAEAARRADHLLELLHRPDGRYVHELATNPLLASTIATIYEAEDGSLPRQRVEVYQKAVDRLVAVWYERMSAADVARLTEHMFAVLRSVAYHVHTRKPTGVIAEPEFRDLFRTELARLRPDSVEEMLETLLRAMRDEVGLLASSAPGAYRFSHQTFQEFLAAQYLRDQPAARVLGHLGDPRWREPILMLLGLVNWRHPSRLPGLVEAMLAEGGALGERFPESALLLADAFAEMADAAPGPIRTVLGSLLRSHRVLSTGGRLPHVRELIEGAVAGLRRGEHGPVVDEVLTETLRRPPDDTVLACTTARMVTALEIHEPGVVAALAEAAARWDDAGLGHPIAEALGVAAARAADAGSAAALLPHNRVRAVLRRNPDLVARIAGDPRWGAVLLALFGGVLDLATREDLHQYIRMANYLQLDEEVRAGFLPVFTRRWGRDDPIYAIAVHLDVKGMADRKRHARPPELSADAIVRDSPFAGDFLAALARDDFAGLLDTLRSRVRDGDLRYRGDALLALWAAGADIDERLAADPEAAGAVRQRIGALAVTLRDGVLRAGQRAERDLQAAAVSGRLDAGSWGRLAEAVTAVLLRAGAEPLRLDSDELPPEHRRRAMVEDLFHRFAGWGDNALLDAAKFADAHKGRTDAVITALNDAGSARHADYGLYRYWWPADRLAFPRHDPLDIPVGVLDMLSRVPRDFTLARYWVLSDVLPALVKVDPELLPEALAIAAAVVEWRGEVVAALDPELLRADDPVRYVLARARRLADPWHRTRSLARLAELFPDHRDALTAEAVEAAGRLTAPRQLFEAHEWLSRLVRGAADRDRHVRACERAADLLTDPVDAVIALLRLARLHPPGRFAELVHAAVERSRRVPGSADRARLLQVIGEHYADDERTAAAVAAAIAGLGDPAERAYAARRWGDLLWTLPRGPGWDAELWTLLGVYARAAEYADPAPGGESADAGNADAGRAEVVRADGRAVRALDRTLEPLAAGDLDGPLRERLGGLVDIDPDSEPVVTRWLHHPDQTVARTAALMLAEYRGLRVDMVDALFGLQSAQADLVRHRAMDVLAGMSGRPYRCLSTVGAAFWLDSTVRAGQIRDIDPVAAQALTWFPESVLVDTPGEFDALCDMVESGAGEAVKQVIRRACALSDRTWRRLLERLAHGSPALQAVLLDSVSAIASRSFRKDDSDWMDDQAKEWLLNQDRRRELWSVLESLDRDRLARLPLRSLDEDAVLAAVVDALKETGGALAGDSVACARRRVEAMAARSFGELLSGEPAEVLPRLAGHGATFFGGARRSEEAVTRYLNSGDPGLPWIELLVRWAEELLAESVNDGPGDPNYLRSYVLQLLAAAADINRDTFRRAADPSRFEGLLVEALLFAYAYPTRTSAAKLLGILRLGSEAVLDALLKALSDVQFVRLAAIDAIPELRGIDQAAVDRLTRGLHEPSATRAWAAAQLLAAIARTRTLPDGLRTMIIDALAGAVADPRSHRTIHFAHTISAIPEMPQLDDAFADALRMVYGFRDTVPETPAAGDAAAPSAQN
ncbi:caspase family protein [Actinomadura sp.]|uniref:caspase, EACC1-associated type n=1 Tax=Actinomadura sp. TaxID=1989 RepID=UPI0037C86331